MAVCCHPRWCGWRSLGANWLEVLLLFAGAGEGFVRPGWVAVAAGLGRSRPRTPNKLRMARS